MPQFRLIPSQYQSTYILPYITNNKVCGCVIPLRNHKVDAQKYCLERNVEYRTQQQKHN